jgi:hypothetical protein
MIYLHRGAIKMTGSSSLLINPPTSAPYAGISVYQDRNDSNDVNLGGSVSISGTGVFYFPSAAINQTDSSFLQSNQLIASDVSMNVNSRMTINLNNTFLSRHQAFLVK